MLGSEGGKQQAEHPERTAKAPAAPYRRMSVEGRRGQPLKWRVPSGLHCWFRSHRLLSNPICPLTGPSDFMLGLPLVGDVLNGSGLISKDVDSVALVKTGCHKPHPDDRADTNACLLLLEPVSASDVLSEAVCWRFATAGCCPYRLFDAWSGVFFWYLLLVDEDWTWISCLMMEMGSDLVEVDCFPVCLYERWTSRLVG
ncbi:hypothetical protein Nepgr_002647 [Nepenthes gracilis]|uniref:Uncharacterized protein n=1 Tax=Nepenthes gracilis TaxID=150966 RepID=A0AAD3P7C8_NEPGR|nr:hypothetical protein Nepgr_002647 [Nepenthes gracilis]